MGTVVPARQVLLKSRVSGEIVSLHPEFIEGGLLKKGDVVVQIDPEDYKLAVTEKQSQVVAKEYELKLELGRQDVAKREWALLKDSRQGKKSDAELALRKPHLRKARADLAAAEAELKQARLNLSRTTVRAPFNAIVYEKHVDMGSQVSSQEQLATLVGTDLYWIRVPLPVDRLRWITIPRNSKGTGSGVRVRWGTGLKAAHERIGRVVKLLGDMESKGRMARVLIAVADPLGLKKNSGAKPPLLIGDYLRVEIEGQELDHVYRIPRTALRDNKRIWIAGKDGTLQIREVDPVWRDLHTVLLRNGLEPGERLIVSDLAAPVQGMRIRVDLPAGEAPARKRPVKRERS
jgi:RND family efflux transporter MFP subunit